MSHIFISYSRKDIELAQKIVDALSASKLDTWIDWKSIPTGEDWKQEIYRGIEEADAFLFLISPDSVKSEMCNKEIAHAVKNGKRILPIFISRHDVGEVNQNFHTEKAREEISKRNYLFCRPGVDDFNKTIEEIRNTIHTDYEWLKYHNQLQNKALAWERAQSDNSRLLRGKELREAEEQLAKAGSQKDPQPTDLHRNYVLAGQRNEVRIRRQFIFGLFAALAIMFFLSLVALVQRNTARTEAKRARLGELSALALSKRDNLDLAMLLGIEAYLYDGNQQSIGSLYTVTQDSYHIYGYLNGHANWVHEVLFTPDMNHLLSASADGSVFLWDINAGTQSRKIYQGQEFIRSIAIDKHAKNIAIGDETGNVFLIDFETGKLLRELDQHRYTVTSVAFSPDGKLLASTGWDNEVVIWNVETGGSAATLTTNNGLNDDIWDISFSPNGNHLVATTGRGYMVVWDVGTFKVVREIIGHSDWAVAAEYSPDGKLLATGGIDDRIVIWDTENNYQIVEELKTISGVRSFSFTPDGNQLIVGCDDGVIRIWSVDSWQILIELKGGHSQSIRTLDVSANGEFIASGGTDDSIVIWNLSSSKFSTDTLQLSRTIESASYAGNNNVLAVGTTKGEIYLWEINTGKVRYIPDLIKSGTLYALEFDPKENILVTGSYDSTIALWDWRTGELITKLDGYSSVGGIAFDKSGKILATTDAVGNIFLWDLENYEQIASGQNNPARSVAFNPNGKNLASGDDDAYVLLLDLASQPGHILDQKQEAGGIVMDIEFNVDGSKLGVASAAPSLVLYNVENDLLENPMALDEHKGAVMSIAFSPDGKLLASGGDDGTIIIWDVDSGQALGEPFADNYGNIVDVDFTNDGSKIVIVGDEGKIDVRFIDPLSLVKISCKIANRNFTRSEWNKYFPNESYRATCTNLPIEPEATPTVTPSP